MPTYIVTYPSCGTEHEPGGTAIRSGTWRVCPSCRSDEAVLALLHLQHTRLVAAERVLRRGSASDHS